MYVPLEHGHDLRHNVVRLPKTKKSILCSVYQISIFKINQGNVTRRLGSKFIPNTVHPQHEPQHSSLRSSIFLS